MIIKIFGTGCLGCQKLEANAKKAVEELGLENIQIVHIYDLNEIIENGITMLPAIAFDNEIKAGGWIPDVEEIKKWLQEIQNQ